MEYEFISLMQTLIYFIYLYILFHNINNITEEYVSYQVTKLINIQQFLSAKSLGKNY